VEKSQSLIQERRIVLQEKHEVILEKDPGEELG
jgi:hypothetical protein